MVIAWASFNFALVLLFICFFFFCKKRVKFAIDGINLQYKGWMMFAYI